MHAKGCSDDAVGPMTADLSKGAQEQATCDREAGAEGSRPPSLVTKMSPVEATSRRPTVNSRGGTARGSGCLRRHTLSCQSCAHPCRHADRPANAATASHACVQGRRRLSAQKAPAHLGLADFDAGCDAQAPHLPGRGRWPAWKCRPCWARWRTGSPWACSAQSGTAPSCAAAPGHPPRPV